MYYKALKYQVVNLYRLQTDVATGDTLPINNLLQEIAALVVRQLECVRRQVTATAPVSYTHLTLPTNREV